MSEMEMLKEIGQVKISVCVDCFELESKYNHYYGNELKDVIKQCYFDEIINCIG